MNATVRASAARPPMGRPEATASTDGIGAGIGSDRGTERRDRIRAVTPANAEQIAPIRRAPSSPSTSIRTSPAPNVPTIAPIVFAAYNRPNDSLRCASALR